MGTSSPSLSGAWTHAGLQELWITTNLHQSIRNSLLWDTTEGQSPCGGRRKGGQEMLSFPALRQNFPSEFREREGCSKVWKAETEDTILWLPVVAGGEKEITSAPPHTGDSKGGGKKKGLHQLKCCKELWTERIHRGLVLSASHRKKQETEPAKNHHCYGDLKHWMHSARRRDKRNYKPHFQLHRTSLR